MNDRPKAVTALAIFFGLGAAISFTCCVSLLFPGGPLEPIWRLNPRAREAFGHMGLLGPALLSTVSAACALSAVGLWRGRRWGYRLALSLFTVNLLADIANVVLGVEPRAIVGVPIVGAILILLSRGKMRAYFPGTGAG